MKNEIYLKLNPIERQLKSALLSNYARLSAREFQEFCSIYEQQYGVALTRNEQNCNTCRLKALKKIANEYFQYQEWYQGRWGKKPEDPKPGENDIDPNNTPDVAENNSENNELTNAEG